MSILDVLGQPGLCTSLEVAETLGMSLERVEAQLAYYERLGYIQKVPLTTGCGKACGHCRGCGLQKAEKQTPAYWERVK
ncbi:FeoC-like transcriptional regulator [Peptococcus simiae]|uniref:FeoC-like transcriptional regulator n=1 Tax=Peptococcus simiae TaxID=1643805 RepID=A0ABW9GZ50_9FIRM